MAEDDDLAPVGKAKRDRSAKLSLASIEPTDLDRELAFRDMNDTGNAERFIARAGDDFRHVRQRGWHAWDRLIWNSELGEEMALLAAQGVAQSIKGEVKALKNQKYDDRAGYLAEHANQSGNIGRLNAMLAAAAPELAIAMSEMDGRADLLYLPNAVLQLMPVIKPVAREREHYVTRIARAEYDPVADCPKWCAFIEKIFPDENLRSFVQRALGYTLTGDTSAEAFFLCWGMGRNGKGTMLRTVAFVLGNYAASIPIELLLKKSSPQSGNEAAPQFAQLPATRFVITSEPGPGVSFDEGLLQTLTGRDTIRIRDMYGKPFDFSPQFKLWIAANDRPGVKSSSNAYWRRVKAIPFRVNIGDDEVNPRLEAELHAEAAGILNWMLEGLADWLERGLAPPEEVTAANQSYRDEMDPLHRFLSECVELKPESAIERKVLVTAYHGWCSEEREEPMKDRAFGLALSNKGLKRKHSNGTFYRDVKLTERGQIMRDKADERARWNPGSGLE